MRTRTGKKITIANKQKNMFLFFDTETTGVPKDYKAPVTDLENWPRVIQLAWCLSDVDGRIRNQQEVLIAPDAWNIPAEKFWIDHGFSTEKSRVEGKFMSGVLPLFIADLEQAEYLVAHNMAFDLPILGAEMLRYKFRGKKVPKICTMESTIQFCAIPFAGQRAWLSKKDGKFKWPKLEELHEKLFGKKFDGAHSAGGDVAALKNCFFELLRLGVITLETKSEL